MKKDMNRADIVFEHIKRMILSGEVRCGQRISEEGLVEKFGVSRTPVREALRRLEGYGLIYLKPRSYAEVISLSEEEIEKIVVVRNNLECLAIELVTAMIDDTICKRLREAHNNCSNALLAGDFSEIFEKDSQLHFEIAKATKNQYLLELLERLDAKIQLYRISKCLNFKVLEQDIKQHDAIFEAICAGDKKRAQELMSRHILGHLK